MGMISTITVLAIVSFLHIFAFVLAVGAEMRRSTGKVVPDEYDERSFCSYDSDASTTYGLSAFALLLLSQLLVMASTRCLCCEKTVAATDRLKSSTIVSFFFCWLTFFIAEACLLAGSAKNAYHTKYVGYYAKRDLISCAALRKGVFTAGAAMIIISLALLISFYWARSKPATANGGGWQKHTNEAAEVGMTDHPVNSNI